MFCSFCCVLCVVCVCVCHMEMCIRQMAESLVLPTLICVQLCITLHYINRTVGVARGLF